MLRENTRSFMIGVEIALVIVLTPIVWFIGLLLILCSPRLAGTLAGMLHDEYGWHTIRALVVVAMVLVFDVAWIILVVIKSRLVEGIRAKVYLTVLVLTFSASLLSAIIWFNAMRGVL